MTTTVNGANTGAELRTNDRKTRAARAAVAIEELVQQRLALALLPLGSEAPEVAWRDRELRLALIAARLAGWWGVLARTTPRSEVPRVFMAAVYSARSGERVRAWETSKRARFWAERVAGADSGAVTR